MKKTARFEKVSERQFIADLQSIRGGEITTAKEIYSRIKLPKRATAGSAGYDFFMPEDCVLNPGETLTVPTGIRCEIDEGWVLSIYPRSGLGFKYRIQLDNTVGIIDSDYYYAENEGHIIIKITNDTKDNKRAELTEGSGFAQGIFTQYGITYDDDAAACRRGGFGSTDSNEQLF